MRSADEKNHRDADEDAEEDFESAFEHETSISCGGHGLPAAERAVAAAEAEERFDAAEQAHDDGGKGGGVEGAAENRQQGQARLSSGGMEDGRGPVVEPEYEGDQHAGEECHE